VPSTPPLPHHHTLTSSVQDDAFFSSRRERAPLRDEEPEEAPAALAASPASLPLQSPSDTTAARAALRPAATTWAHIQELRAAVSAAMDERRAEMEAAAAAAVAAAAEGARREGAARALALCSPAATALHSFSNSPGCSPVEGSSASGAQSAAVVSTASLATVSTEGGQHTFSLGGGGGGGGGALSGSASPDEHRSSTSPLPELFLSQAQGLMLHSGRSSPRCAGVKDSHNEARDADCETRRASKAPRLAAPQAVRKLVPSAALAAHGLSLANVDDATSLASTICGGHAFSVL
jgi:hypothetical protein